MRCVPEWKTWDIERKEERRENAEQEEWTYVQVPPQTKIYFRTLGMTCKWRMNNDVNNKEFVSAEDPLRGETMVRNISVFVYSIVYNYSHKLIQMC